MITDFRQRIFNGEDLLDVSTEAVQHYTDKIGDALNPMYDGDHIYVIAALRKTEEALSRHDPAASQAAGYLCKMLGTSERSITIPTDMPEDIANEIYRSMKRV